jgi:hypothetical protein
MEEIVAADAMKDEILEDARKKAEHILKEADEESARELEAGAALAAKSRDEIARDCAARIARRRAEASARLPLDRMRARTEFVDLALREATKDFISSLPEAEVGRMAAAMAARGAGLMAGKRLIVKRRGLPRSDAEAAAAAIGADAEAEEAEDRALRARGLAIVAADGSATLSATMDLVEESLLDRDRAALASALCSEAMGLGRGGA